MRHALAGASRVVCLEGVAEEVQATAREGRSQRWSSQPHVRRTCRSGPKTTLSYGRFNRQSLAHSSVLRPQQFQTSLENGKLGFCILKIGWPRRRDKLQSMVEKIDVAFDACDANAEGAMMHGGPRLRERNTEGMRSVPNGSGDGSRGKTATHLHLGISRFAP